MLKRFGGSVPEPDTALLMRPQIKMESAGRVIWLAKKAGGISSLPGEESNFETNSARQVSHSRGVKGVLRESDSAEVRAGAAAIKSGGFSKFMRL